MGLDDPLRFRLLLALCWLSQMQIVQKLNPALEALDVSEEETAVALEDVDEDELQVVVVSLHLGLLRECRRDFVLDLG